MQTAVKCLWKICEQSSENFFIANVVLSLAYDAVANDIESWLTKLNEFVKIHHTDTNKPSQPFWKRDRSFLGPIFDDI